MSPKAKKIWNIFTTVLVVIIVVFALLLVGVRIFGLCPYYVLSGSMEPTYHVGSLIYVKKVNPADVRPGDPITFVMDSTDRGGRHVTATHRVMECRDAGEKEVTNEKTGETHTEHCYEYLQMGDYVNPEYNPDFKPDPEKFPNYQGYDKADEETRRNILNDSIESHGAWVSSVNLLGKPVFTIPVLGYVANFVQNPPGLYVTIAACALLLLLVFLPDILGGKKKEEKAVQTADAVSDASGEETKDTKSVAVENDASEENGEEK